MTMLDYSFNKNFIYYFNLKWLQEMNVKCCLLNIIIWLYQIRDMMNYFEMISLIWGWWHRQYLECFGWANTTFPTFILFSINNFSVIVLDKWRARMFLEWYWSCHICFWIWCRECSCQSWRWAWQCCEGLWVCSKIGDCRGFEFLLWRHWCVRHETRNKCNEGCSVFPLIIYFGNALLC